MTAVPMLSHFRRRYCAVGFVGRLFVHRQRPLHFHLERHLFKTEAPVFPPNNSTSQQCHSFASLSTMHLGMPAPVIDPMMNTNLPRSLPQQSILHILQEDLIVRNIFFRE